MTGPKPSDPAAPIAALPVCAVCGHLHICHRHGRCRGDPGGRAGCDCTHFTTDPPTGRPAPAAGERPAGARLDLDVSEDCTPR